MLCVRHAAWTVLRPVAVLEHLPDTEGYGWRIRLVQAEAGESGVRTGLWEKLRPALSQAGEAKDYEGKGGH